MLEAIEAECASVAGPRKCEVGFEGRRRPAEVRLLLVAPSSGAPIVPLAAAAMAATLLAAEELMLFLRVTRWAGFMVPADMECECGRDLGREPTMLLEACRCWLEGRTLIGSWMAGSS